MPPPPPRPRPPRPSGQVRRLGPVWPYELDDDDELDPELLEPMSGHGWLFVGAVVEVAGVVAVVLGVVAVVWLAACRTAWWEE